MASIEHETTTTPKEEESSPSPSRSRHVHPPPHPIRAESGAKISYSLWQETSSVVVSVTNAGTKLGSMLSWKNSSADGIDISSSSSTSSSSPYNSNPSSLSSSSSSTSSAPTSLTGSCASITSPTLPSIGAKPSPRSLGATGGALGTSGVVGTNANPLVNSAGMTKRTVVSLFPKLTIRAQRSYVTALIQGPHLGDDLGPPTAFSTGAVAAQAVSLYPALPLSTTISKQQGLNPFAKIVRQGDPVADSYCASVDEAGVTVAAIGDGLHFGKAAKDASKRATENFVTTLKKLLPALHKFKHFQVALEKSFLEAHKSITKDLNDPSLAGNTSLLGGALVQIGGEETDLRKAMNLHVPTEEDFSKTAPKWAFVGGKVGTDKVFHFSTKRQVLTEVASIVHNGKPTGHLGPQLESKELDPKNGAWANFDPLTLGSPSNFGFKADKWEELRSDETQSDLVEGFRNNQITATLRKLILSALNSVQPSPSSLTSSTSSLPPLPTASLASRVTARVIRHCQEVIASTRDWIEDHPNERMPESTDFKGKMDHCTCLVVKVGTGAFVSTPVPIVVTPEHEEEIAAKKRRRRKASGLLHEGIFQDYDDELEGEVVTDVSPSPPALKERACSFVDLLKQAISNATRSSVYHNLPNRKVAASTFWPERNRSLLVMGPKLHTTVEQYYEDVYACHTISTYPHPPEKPLRDGDPICDSYALCIQENGTTVAVVADGCNWGKRPQLAAKRAKKAFLEFILAHQDWLSDAVEVGHMLLLALKEAHEAVLDGKLPEEDRLIGTTTILGGVLIEVERTEEEKKQGAPTHGFVAASVGDCKAFLYSKSSDTMRDITPSSRTNVNDPMDPGGRLGPALPNDQPDLRNLSFYYCPCEPGDMIFLMSDGVYDNLDPASLGLTPRDLDLDLDSWDDKDYYDQVKLVKENFLNSFLRRRILYKEADLSSSVGTTSVSLPLTPRTIVER